jgi:hypothetical protein
LDDQIVYRRFVDSSIGLIPPGEYASADQYSREAMAWLAERQARLCAQPGHHPRIQTAQSPQGERRVFCPRWNDCPPVTYKLDGFYQDPETQQDVALEFYGCHWHGCPRCYTGSSRKSWQVNGKSLEQRFQETKIRETRLRLQGLHVVTMWSCAFEAAAAADVDTSSLTCERCGTTDRDWTVEGYSHLKIRDAYYGGRTAALKLYHQFDLDSGERGRYFDFTSLYPWALKYGRFPVSHPVKRVKPLQEPRLQLCRGDWGGGVRYCPKDQAHHHVVLGFFGIAKVSILPPRSLLHPVLPYRCRSGKLTFPLCAHCAEHNNQDTEPCDCFDSQRAWTHTYCSGELEAALDEGYQILHYYEILDWSQTASVKEDSSLFAGYVNAFLQIKQQASGWPRDCANDLDAQQRYVTQYQQEENIHLDPTLMRKSNALRSLAKLLLNSLYGKFGQRLNLRKTHLITDPSALCDVMTHPKHIVVDFHILSEDMMQVETEDNTYFQTTDLKTNVVIAAFTSSWARLKLWSVIRSLGRRVFYTDTDSLIFSTQPGQDEPPLGQFLGQLADELTCRNVGCEGCAEGSHSLREYVACGAKNYAYVTDNQHHVCKVRGFTLNATASLQLNFDTMKRNILQWCEQQQEQQEDRTDNADSRVVVTSTLIARNKQTAQVYNRTVSKLYGIVLDKQRVDCTDFTTLPFGYRPPILTDEDEAAAEAAETRRDRRQQQQRQRCGE